MSSLSPTGGGNHGDACDDLVFVSASFLRLWLCGFGLGLLPDPCNPLIKRCTTS
jgi:hypothetical protein